MPCVESCATIAAAQEADEERAIAAEVERDIEMATAAISGEFLALKAEVRKLRAAMVEISLAISSERQHGTTGVPGVWRCFARIQLAIEEAL